MIDINFPPTTINENCFSKNLALTSEPSLENTTTETSWFLFRNFVVVETREVRASKAWNFETQVSFSLRVRVAKMQVFGSLRELEFVLRLRFQQSQLKALSDRIFTVGWRYLFILLKQMGVKKHHAIVWFGLISCLLLIGTRFAWAFEKRPNIGSDREKLFILFCLSRCRDAIQLWRQDGSWKQRRSFLKTCWKIFGPLGQFREGPRFAGFAEPFWWAGFGSVSGKGSGLRIW